MNAIALSRDDRMLGLTSAICTALVFVVVGASAWLRLAGSSCPPGGCAAFMLEDAVRLAHRIAAMGVTVIALLMAAIAWKAPSRPGRRVATAVIIVVVAVLSVVGRMSAGTPPPAVVLTNLLGGLTLLAMTAGLATAAFAPRTRLSRPFVAAFALLALATVTGGIVTASSQADHAALELVHRAASWTALAAWLLLAIGAAQPPGARMAARLTIALVTGQALLAVSAPGWAFAPWLHNLLTSAALCCAIAAVLASRGAAHIAPATRGRVPAGP